MRNCDTYNERYRQVHARSQQWFSDEPTPIVEQLLQRRFVPEGAELLEIGCGEGRDAAYLLKKGWRVLADRKSVV